MKLPNNTMKKSIDELLSGKTCIGYCRVSSKDQVENTSLEEQKALIEYFAMKHNMQIIDTIFEDKSAMKPNKRPKFNKMVENLQNGAADVVIFAFLDRMSRNAVDAYKILEMVENDGLVVVFVQDNLILKAPVHPSQMLMFDTLLGVSNYRVRQDREKCKAGILARALNDKFRPCKPPYGYKHIGTKRNRSVAVSKKRADFVQKAFELYSTGQFSTKELPQKLYELGFRYDLQPSKVIPKQSLISMLRNLFYTGSFHVKQADEDVKGNFEPIISKELYDKVQDLLDQAPKTPRKHKLLYSKLLLCENCGHAMVGDVKEKPSGKKYVYYRCTNPKCTKQLSINETAIDTDLENYLKEIRLGLIPVEIVEEVLKSELYGMQQDLSQLKRNVSHKYDAERRLNEQIAENDIVDEKFIQAKMSEIEEKYGDLDSKIYVLEKQIEMVKTKYAEAVKKRLFDVYSGFDMATKKKTIETVANIFKCTSTGLKMTFKSAFRKIRHR